MQKLTRTRQEDDLLEAFQYMPVKAGRMLLRMAQSYGPQSGQRPLLRLVVAHAELGLCPEEELLVAFRAAPAEARQMLLRTAQSYAPAPCSLRLVSVKGNWR